MKKRIIYYSSGIVLFVMAIIIGLFCFRDYGVAWDESIQRGIGMTTYEYVFNNDQSLKTVEFRNLGTGFELPLIFIEKLSGLKDSRDIYLSRHLATYLFSFAGAFFGYILALRVFKKQFIACLAFIMLAFNPRMFAHAFFNSKDIPFLSSFIIVFLLCQIAFEKNKPGWYLSLGLACGYATSIRAMGIMLVPIISLFFIIDIARAFFGANKRLAVIGNFVIFLTGFCLMLYIAWPILWSNPVHYFIEEFRSLAHIRWYGDVFFEGNNIKGDHLPLTYLPVWFSITIPELWLLSGLAGLVSVFILFLLKPAKFLLNTPDRNFLLYIACFIFPVVIVTILNSVDYDDWRHLYFIYPAFVMLALFAINKLMKGRWKMMIRSLCILQIIFVAVFMFKSHPYEQVYFNHFVLHKDEYLRNHFDLDYWDVGYKDALEYILARDSAASIKVACVNGPIYENVSILPLALRKRIVVVKENEHPDYFITNFRNHPEEFNYPHIFYGLKILNSTVSRVYKVH